SAPRPSPARAPPAGPARAGPRSSASHLPQLLEQLALLLVHALRDLDAHACEHVALARAAELRCAATLDAQELPVLGTGGDLRRPGAGGAGRPARPAEGCGRVRHRPLDDEVVSAPLVDRRGGDARDHYQVACGAAVLAGLALALEADARPVLDAGLDLHR